VHGEHDQEFGLNLARWARDQLQHFLLTLTNSELPMVPEITPESLEIGSAWLSARLDSKVPV
jgi:predicted esterase